MQLIFYRNAKKLFDVDSDMSNFGRLLERMESEKRLERGFLKENGMEFNGWKDEFSVTETRANKLRALYGAVLGAGMFTAGILCWKEINEEPYYPLYYAMFLVMFVWGIEGFARAMLQKVTVTYRDIHVRDGIGRVKSYSFRDITGVEEQKNFIILYVNQKKIAKIDKRYKNFALLAERLKQEEFL